jgi:hypothetical protein
MIKYLPLFLALLFISQVSFAQNTPLRPKVDRPVYFDLSPPLRDMVKNHYGPDHKIGEVKEVKNEFDVDKDQPGQIPNAPVTDLGMQDYFGMLTTDTTLQSFDGVPNVSGSVPPDTYGEAGPEQYFQVVNLSYAIFNKTGGSVFGPYPNSTIWAGFPNNDNGGDAVVHYDENANRWLFTQFSLPNYPAGPFFQMIAVSQTPDPTGPWYRYQYQFPYMPDYPKFGIWPDGYYMSANLFGPNWLGNGAYGYDRNAMLAGDPNAAMVAFTLPPAVGFITLYPSDCDGPFPAPGTPNYFGFIKNSGSQFFGIYEFHADFANPNNSTFGNLLNLPVTPYNTFQGGVPQLGSTAKLESLADRLMYRLQYRKFPDHQSMVINHTVGASFGRAGVRWYEFRKTTGQWGIYQQSTYAPSDSNYRWMGSIAMDTAGSIALGFSISSKYMFPGLRYTGRKKTDPLNQMTMTERSIVNGGGSQTGVWSGRSRWGDYAGMSIDPVNPTTFWFTSEYYSSTNSSSWMTRIGAFTFGNTFSTMASAYPGLVCLGDSVQLNVYAYGGANNYSYLWKSIPAGFTSTQKNPKVMPADTVKYVVITTDEQSVRSDTVQVKVVYPVSANAGNDTTICSWVNVMNIHGVAAYYKMVGWGTTGDGKFGNMYDLNTTYTLGENDKNTGAFDLKLIAFAITPCHGTIISTKHVTVDACTGIAPAASDGLKMSIEPNPAKEKVRIAVRGLKDPGSLLTITGMDGRRVFTTPIEPVKEEAVISVDLSGFAKGIYIVRMRTEGNVVTGKLVVQ